MWFCTYISKKVYEDIKLAVAPPTDFLDSEMRPKGGTTSLLLLAWIQNVNAVFAWEYKNNNSPSELHFQPIVHDFSEHE